MGRRLERLPMLNGRVLIRCDQGDGLSFARFEIQHIHHRVGVVLNVSFGLYMQARLLGYSPDQTGRALKPVF